MPGRLQSRKTFFFSDFFAGKTYTLKGTELSLVSKYSKKIKYADIASYYCPRKLPVTAKCGHVDHAFGKVFACQWYIQELIKIFQIMH